MTVRETLLPELARRLLSPAAIMAAGDGQMMMAAEVARAAVAERKFL